MMFSELTGAKTGKLNAGSKVTNEWKFKTNDKAPN